MSKIFENEEKLQQAIALFYDEVDAPKVTAKGKGELAERMIDLANQHHVHLHEDPLLLKQLANIDIGERIPQELFQVIAEIISFVYWLEGKKPKEIFDDA